MEAYGKVRPTDRGAAHRGELRPRATASGKWESSDDFLGEDIAPPNRRAQYRGFRMILGFVLAAGIVALVLGSIEGANNIAAAFPTFSSVLDGAAWSRCLSGLSTLMTVAAVVVFTALFWRWRIGRARRRRRA